LDGIEEERQTQLAICLQALEIFPLDAQLLCAMGGYLQAQDRWDLATRAYQTAYQYGQVNPETWHVVEIREVAAACYCLSLQLQRKDDEAQRVLEEALENHPQSVRLRRQLIEQHVKHGRRDEALRQVNALPASYVGRESLRGAIRGACLAGQQNWVPALAYLESSHEAGCRETLCLRWLTITLLAVGEHDRARAILDEWQQIDPANGEVSRYREVISADTEQTPPAAPRQLRVDRGISSDDSHSTKPKAGSSAVLRSAHSPPRS
jgi:tetratricopeptide (TPR) repeat protein